MAAQFADDFEKHIEKGTVSNKLKPNKMTSVPDMLERRQRVRDLLLEGV
jgi:hypothetical protein